MTDVSIHAEVSRSAVFPGSPSYGLAVSVEGTSIASISVVPPGGGSFALVYDPGCDEWGYLWDGYANLDALATGPGFGTFLLTITDTSAVVDTVSLTYADPRPVPLGYADLVSPPHGATGVPLDPTLAWTCAAAPCGNFAWFMELYPVAGSGASYEADILDPSITSWTPGCLAPSTLYELWISSGSTVPGGGSGVTSAGDAFLYFTSWESMNVMRFTTQAPSVLASVSFRNAGANPAVYTASPAVVGATWSGTVDLTTTGHSFARVLGFAGPASVALPGGQVRLGSSPVVFRLAAMSGPQANWTAAIPYSCALIGLSIPTQAVLFGGVSPFALSNSQDLVVGH